jgi:hypothetical protein
MRVLEYDAVIQHRAGKQHGNADMLSRLGVIGEQEPALTSCEDALREPPEERRSISLALHGDGNANYTKRFTVVQGYVIALAAGLPAKMGLSLEVQVTADDEQPVINDSIDISIRGPVHSGDGLNEDQSTLLRAAYKQLTAATAGNVSEDATVQVCSAQTSNTSISTQGGDLESMIWHEYEQTITAAEVSSIILVTAPRVYVIQPANLIDQATTIITSLDSISVKEWSDAQRADAAWAPCFDYFEQQRLPTDKTIIK